MSKNPWDKDNFKRDDGREAKKFNANDEARDNESSNKERFGSSSKKNSSFFNFFNGKQSGDSSGDAGLLSSIENFFSGQGPSRKSVKVVILVAILLWLASGLYTVEPEQQAIITRFSKYVGTASSGLHYHLPSPMESVIKETVTRIHTVKVGNESDTQGLSGGSKLKVTDAQRLQSSLMLTGDENVIDMQFEVQWHINNLRDFTFNVKNPIGTIVDVSQSVIREIVACSQLAAILTNGRALIESNAKKALQDILDQYGSGIEIVLVQMLKADPPTQVIDSFRDVQTARVDKESEINRADAYRNDIIPKARGKAHSIINDAESYAAEVVQQARGRISRFDEVYSQYKDHKQITKNRIYLETMEELFSDWDKIIIDSGASKTGVLPYMPLQELQNKKQSKNTE